MHYTMPVPVPLTVPQIWELAGSEAIKKAGVSSAADISEVPPPAYRARLRKAGIAYYVGFAGYVGFHQLGETRNALGYEVITFDDQSVVTGKYSMSLTLGQGGTGGPPGFATERFVTVKDLKLVERTVRSSPVYTNGKRELMPGELIVRRLSGAERYLEDQYALGFDSFPGSEVWVSFYPSQCFSVSVTDSRGRPVALLRFNENRFHFGSMPGERYFLTLSGRLSDGRRPDRYGLVATIGPIRGDLRGDPAVDSVKWTSPHRSDSE